jgi:hypothetical protein
MISTLGGAGSLPMYQESGVGAAVVPWMRQAASEVMSGEEIVEEGSGMRRRIARKGKERLT